ncbi:sodium channel protein Nach isoform X2 [Drosophila eugracilis]|uniref:sodium channel protein Nach isoform X2 n=1 Tax=Drosophila eugracilis TaxID=29029 RepID=UPI0007E89169|nr:sodium channel protein Nach isoform X2 [Drosophila eugracilis]
MGHEEELTPEEVDLKVSPFVGSLRRTWNDFCSTSSIHGLRYTRDEDTNKIVHLVWLLISLVMFICAVVMAHTFYMDYRSSPTRMNVDSDHTPVNNLYFPPITICPDVLFNMQKSEAFLKTLQLPPGAELKGILRKLHIFYGFMLDDERYSKEDIDQMESVLSLNNLTIQQFVEHLRWDCNEILYRCRFNGNILDCSKIFQLSKTFFGHCCSFNLRQKGLNFTAQRAIGGMKYGLSLILRYKDDSYDPVQSYSYGVKLLIQEVDAFPSAHAAAKFIAFNTETFAALRPQETFCSAAVKALTIKERNCVFQNEFHLRYFSNYVYPNCELNCRVTNMVKFCGCHTYFFDFNRTTDRICTFRDIHCLVDNFANIITRKKSTQCYCPLTCEHFDYDVQISNFPLELNMPVADNFYSGIAKNDGILHVFINSFSYRRLRRDLLSNMVTLVSNLGSAFSLFIGMSMLSVVEIIYYFSVILRKNYNLECETRNKMLRKGPKFAWPKANETHNKQPKS